MPSLRITCGSSFSTVVALNKEHTVVGRGPGCDFTVPDQHFSRKHFQITCRDGSFVLLNIDTPGGTRLNGRQIRGLSPLRDGDRIQVSDVEVVFESPARPMVKGSWFGCTDSQAMLGWLRVTAACPKRLRLFVAACCRQLDDSRNHPEWVEDAWEMAVESARRVVEAASRYEAAQGVLCCLLRCLFHPFHRPFIDPTLLGWNDSLLVKLARTAYEDQVSPAGTLDPVWLGILADALEDAGADDDLVAHLRERGGVHVRGCFVLDLLLGKE